MNSLGIVKFALKLVNSFPYSLTEGVSRGNRKKWMANFLYLVEKHALTILPTLQQRYSMAALLIKQFGVFLSKNHLENKKSPGGVLSPWASISGFPKWSQKKTQLIRRSQIYY